MSREETERRKAELDEVCNQAYEALADLKDASEEYIQWMPNSMELIHYMFSSLCRPKK